MLAVGLGGLAVPTRATAHAPQRPFAALATAQGVRSTYDIPGYLVVETIADGGAPVTQATLESSGVSQAFASIPYPGDLVITLGGTGAAFGAPTGDFRYPLIVGASDPTTPSAELADPTSQYVLRAAAGPANSSAHGAMRVGGDVSAAGDLTAESSVVTAEDGTVTAAAVAIIDGLSLADGLVSVGSVESRSTTTLAPDGTRTTESELVIAGSTVAGQPVGIGPDGIIVSGSSIPVPVDVAGTLQPVLDSAGVSLRVTDGVGIEGGSSSDALEVRFRHATPPPGPPEGELVLRIGATTTSILSGDAVAAAPPITTTGTTAPPAAPATPAPPPPAPAAALPTGLPATPTAAPAAPSSIRSLLDLRDTTRLFYVVLIVAGAVLAAGSAGWSWKGRRASWTTF